MNEQNSNLTVLGQDIVFRPGANLERVAMLAQMLEERFSEYTSRPNGSQSKEINLIFLALSLADELHQMKITQEETRKRIEALLDKIEKTVI